MAWITLTPDDLQGRLTAAEIDTVTTVAGNGNTIQQIISEVTSEVRGYAGTASTLGPDGTIPDEAKSSALSIIVLRYVSQIPSGKLVTEARTKAAENGQTFLRDIGNGKVRLVPPTIAAPQQTARPSVLTVQPGNCGNSREELRRL